MQRILWSIGLVTILMTGIGIPALHAESYPSRPITLVICQDAGSGADVNGRMLAEELGKVLGTSIPVINKPGAGSAAGADFVAKSKKDGYTLLYATVSAMVYTKAWDPEAVPYEPAKDLDPLGLHCYFPVAAFTQQTTEWKTFKDLVDYAKKNPGAVRVSVPGRGNIDHFNVEIIKSMTGAQFNVIPFKGGGAAMIALLGGHVDVACVAMPMAAPHVKAGKLRVLLLSNKVREFPDVPITTDLGYKESLLYPWFGLYAPTGVPDEVKKALIPAIETVVKNAEHKEKLEKLGVRAEYRSPAELRKLQEDDYKRARSLAIKSKGSESSGGR